MHISIAFSTFLPHFEFGSQQKLNLLQSFVGCLQKSMPKLIQSCFVARFNLLALYAAVASCGSGSQPGQQQQPRCGGGRVASAAYASALTNRRRWGSAFFNSIF